MHPTGELALRKWILSFDFSQSKQAGECCVWSIVGLASIGSRQITSSSCTPPRPNIQIGDMLRLCEATIFYICILLFLSKMSTPKNKKTENLFIIYVAYTSLCSSQVFNQLICQLIGVVKYGKRQPDHDLRPLLRFISKSQVHCQRVA